MNYGTLETEIKTRLNAYFEANDLADLFEAVEIPENDSQGKRAYPKGTVYVQYFKSSYSPSQSANSVSQHETVIIRLTFTTRSLRQADGFYNLVEHVKTNLLGYKPIDAATRLVIDEYDFLHYENNEIQPYLQMKCEAMNVQSIDEEETSEDLFTHLTIKTES